MDKIKNLSLRKTIVLYMTISLLVCFFLFSIDCKNGNYSTK